MPAVTVLSGFHYISNIPNVLGTVVYATDLHVTVGIGIGGEKDVVGVATASATATVAIITFSTDMSNGITPSGSSASAGIEAFGVGGEATVFTITLSTDSNNRISVRGPAAEGGFGTPVGGANITLDLNSGFDGNVITPSGATI